MAFGEGGTFNAHPKFSNYVFNPFFIDNQSVVIDER